MDCKLTNILKSRKKNYLYFTQNNQCMLWEEHYCSGGICLSFFFSPTGMDATELLLQLQNSRSSTRGVLAFMNEYF